MVAPRSGVNDLSLLVPEVRQAHQLAQLVHQLVTGGYVDARGRVVGGTVPVTTSTGRSIAEQEALYAQRDTNPYPVNRPGDSAHQYGLAVDSDVPDAQQPIWRAVREYFGFRVPSNDEVHGEVPGWRALVGL